MSIPINFATAALRMQAADIRAELPTWPRWRLRKRAALQRELRTIDAKLKTLAETAAALEKCEGR